MRRQDAKWASAYASIAKRRKRAGKGRAKCVWLVGRVLGCLADDLGLLAATLPLVVFDKLNRFRAVDRLEPLALADSTLQSTEWSRDLLQDDFLGRFHFLLENRLGLPAIASLLGLVSATSYGRQSPHGPCFFPLSAPFLY